MAHILLIEPDAVLAATYEATLKADGHTVATAHSAQNAIGLADISEPDVVILELQLSNHSGIEFLYEFRSYPEWQRIPVIILSTIPEREFINSHELLTNELGVARYCYKPKTTLATLQQVVHSLVTVKT